MLCLKTKQIFITKWIRSLKEKSKEENSRKFFKSKPISHYGFINCFYCNQRGHHIKDCHYRNGTYMLRPNEKLLWLPKASTSKSHSFLFTNFVGPKTTWVPPTLEQIHFYVGL